MLDYIEGFLGDTPSSLKEYIVTDAPNNLLELGDDTTTLHPTDSKIYYRHVIQLLWLAKRSQPNLLPPL